MSQHFESIADDLVGVGASDQVLYAQLAAVMDRVGVPFVSFSRYLDQPAIVRLFGERGVTLVDGADRDAAAAKAVKIRAWYKPGDTPMPGETIFDREPAPRFTTVGRAVVVAGPNDIAVAIGGQRLRGLSARDGLDIIAGLTEALG